MDKLTLKSRRAVAAFVLASEAALFASLHTHSSEHLPHRNDPHEERRRVVESRRESQVFEKPRSVNIDPTF